MSFTVNAAVLVIVVTFSVMQLPDMYRTALRNRLARNVLELDTNNGPVYEGYYGGTGFAVKAPSGRVYVVSNRHVCSASQTGNITARRGSESFTLNIIDQSNDADLCLLEAPAGVPGLELARSVVPGQQVYYMGHPRLEPATFVLGEAVGIQEERVPTGIIGRGMEPEECHHRDTMVVETSEFEAILEDYPELSNLPYIQSGRPVQMCYEVEDSLLTTLIIYPGASGSPVVDTLGKVVGVIYAGSPQAGWGVAVPLETVRDYLKGR